MILDSYDHFSIVLNERASWHICTIYASCHLGHRVPSGQSGSLCVCHGKAAKCNFWHTKHARIAQYHSDAILFPVHILVSPIRLWPPRRSSHFRGMQVKCDWPWRRPISGALAIDLQKGLTNCAPAPHLSYQELWTLYPKQPLRA